MKRIVIETVPASQQRWRVPADNIVTPSSIIIRVTDVGDPRHELLAAMHELTTVIQMFTGGDAVPDRVLDRQVTIGPRDFRLGEETGEEYQGGLGPK